MPDEKALTVEDLAALSPEEREAWELEQKAMDAPWSTRTIDADVPSGKWYEACIRIGNATYSVFGTERLGGKQWKHNVDCAVAARNLLPALLLKVARITRELAQWTKWGVVEVAIRNPQVAEYCEHWENRVEVAESRVSDLTKEKDSALQERDRYKQERDAAMKSSDENQAKFVTADHACESAEQDLSLLRARKDYHGEYVEAVERVVVLRDAIKLIIGRKTNVPWREVPDSEVDAYEKEIAALKGESHG